MAHLGKWGRLREDRLFVLDMGNSFLKLVGLTRVGGRITLEILQRRATPPDPLTPPTPQLKEMLVAIPHPPQRVILALSPPAVQVGIMDLPDMPEREFMEAAKWEACAKFHLQPEEASFSALPPWRGAGGRKRTLVAVGKRETLLTRVKLLEGLGLKVGGIKPTTPSLINWLAEGQATKALVDLGKESTRLVLTNGHKTELVRDIGFGGRDINRAIQEALDIDLPAAEKSKLQAQLPLKGGKIPPLESTIRKVVDELAAELRLSFQYHRSQSGQGQEVAEVILGGGGALLGNLSAYLAQKLGMKVRLGGSWKGIELGERRRDGQFFFPAIGVALGELLSTDVHRLDLFRDELNRRRRRESIRAVPRVGLLSALLIAVTGFSVLQTQVNNYGKQLEDYRGVLNDLRNLSQTTRSMRQKKAALAAQLQQMAQLRNNQFRWSPLLRLLGALTPEGIQWKKIEGEEDGSLIIIHLRGTSPNRESIGNYLQNLSKEEHLGEIALNGVERAKSGRYEFELSCWLKDKGRGR